MKALPHTVLAIVLLAAACDRKPSPAAPPPKPAPAQAPPPSAPTAPKPESPPSATTVSALGLTFKVPDGWKSVPPANTMRLAELQVPDPSGDVAKTCTAVFSTAGGDVKANIDRWASQVRDASGQPSTPSIKTRLTDIGSAHIVEMTGAYSPGMGDTNVHQNWMLRGAIVQTSGGMLFIKMTGPAQPMAAAEPAFSTMIDGAKGPQ